MANAPITLLATQYEDYEGWWLKCYIQGTTTPLTIYNNAAGDVSFAKLEIDTDGFLKSAGGAIINPHIGEPYDAWLFPIEAEANANNTVNAKQLADNITPKGLEAPYALIPRTLAELEADTGAEVGKVYIVSDRTNGIFDAVLTASVTPNGYNIVQSVAAPTISFVLRVQGAVKTGEWGGIGDGSDETTFVELIIDYAIQNGIPIDSGSDGKIYGHTAITKQLNGGIEITGNAEFKYIGTSNISSIRLTDASGFISLDGVTFNGNNLAARALSIENENSTDVTQGSVSIKSKTKFINAKNISPATNASTACFIRGGFSKVVFAGEVDGADNSLTAAGVSEGLTVTHFTTSTDDYVKETIVKSCAVIKNVTNSNIALQDADGLKVDAPTDKLAALTVEAGATFINCKGRSIKSQVTSNSILNPIIKRNLYDGISEINLQYAGGVVRGAQVIHDGARCDSIISISQRDTPDNAQVAIDANELKVIGTPSSSTAAFVAFDVTAATAKCEGVNVVNNKVKGAVDHFATARVANIEGNKLNLRGNWCELVNTSFIDATLFGAANGKLSVDFIANSSGTQCDGLTATQVDVVVSHEESNHNITGLLQTPPFATISSGAIGVEGHYYSVANEGGSGIDDLFTVNATNAPLGHRLTLSQKFPSEIPTCKAVGGNLKLESNTDFALTNPRDKLFLEWDGVSWCEISRLTSP